MEPKRNLPLWGKRALIALGVIFGLLFLLFLLGLALPGILEWKQERDSRAFDAKLSADRAWLLGEEQKDNYGSTTPEGTAELILQALTKGDTELASKYYYVLDREKAKASFDKQLAEKGNLDTAINFFNDLLRGTKGCNEAGDGCTLAYEYLTTQDEYVNLPNNPEPYLIKRGSKQRKSENFSLNKFTGVWKAEER